MSSEQAITTMSRQQAISILMLSPCYWMLKTPDRKTLVEEYCATYSDISQTIRLKVGVESVPPVAFSSAPSTTTDYFAHTSRRNCLR